MAKTENKISVKTWLMRISMATWMGGVKDVRW